MEHKKFVFYAFKVGQAADTLMPIVGTARAGTWRLSRGLAFAAEAPAQNMGFRAETFY